MKSVHTDEYQAFLAVIVDVRRRAGLTQQELADRLKRPQSFVTKYENGERRVDIAEFLWIAKALEFNAVKVFAEIVAAARRKKKRR